jgi:hypothetical protein
MASKISAAAKAAFTILKSVAPLIQMAAKQFEADTQHPNSVKIGQVLEIIGTAISFAVDLLNSGDKPVETPAVLAPVVD